jgi:hypothetical protein
LVFVLLLFLIGPAVGLSARDSIRYRGGGAGDDRRASDASDETWHAFSPS